jgi:hypothetical protein
MAKSSAMPAMLPCPFCGKQPKVTSPNSDRKALEWGSEWGRVECVYKRCAVQPLATDGTVREVRGGWRAYRDLAIKRWNTRKEG